MRDCRIRWRGSLRPSLPGPFLLVRNEPRRCLLARVCVTTKKDVLRESFAVFDRSEEGLIPASVMVELLQHAGISVDPEEVCM